MRIRYFSDLHLEFINPNKLKYFIDKINPIDDEICILAGDIGNPYKSQYKTFMNYISNNFRKTFIIAGNHEYYNDKNTLCETSSFMETYFEQYDNISFLNNKYEIYENYCFIGTTLWSHITNPIYKINDVYKIPNFDYIQYNKLNDECVSFLKNTLKEKENDIEKFIIITHHIPSSSLVNIKYKTPTMLPYNQWFYCDMDDFIDINKDKIKCWFYGHTHTPSEDIINEIPFLCNAIGYPNENNTINLQKTITISD